MYLVDTSVWIEFFRPGENTTSQYLAQLIDGNAHLCINSLIEMEILQGLRHDTQVTAMQRYVASFMYFSDVPHAYTRGAARIFRTCRQAGITIRKSIDFDEFVEAVHWISGYWLRINQAPPHTAAD